MTKTSIPTYRVSLKKDRTLRVAEATCANGVQAEKITVAWFREHAPANEVIVLIGLDGKNNVVGIVEVSRGGLHGCAITAREVFQAGFAQSIMESL